MAPNAYFIANDGVVICMRGRHAVQLESMKPEEISWHLMLTSLQMMEL